MEEKKKRNWADIFLSVPVIIILFLFCFPISFVLIFFRLKRMKEKGKAYKRNTIVTALIVLAMCAASLFAMLQQNQWNKKYQSYLAAEDYVSAEQMLDEKKEAGLTVSLMNKYLDLFLLSGDDGKIAEITHEYVSQLDDITMFSESVRGQLEELIPEVNLETQEEITAILNQVALAVKDKEQKEIEESIALAEEKAAKESSQAAEKAAKESSQAAEKAAKESSQAAEKAAKESSRAAEESKEAAAEREERLEELSEEIQTYITHGSKDTLKKIQKADSEDFDEVWLCSFADDVERLMGSPAIESIGSKYCELYRESHNETMSKQASEAVELWEDIAPYVTQKQQLEKKYDSIDLDQSYVNSAQFYVTQRLETAYDDTISGSIQKEIDSHKKTSGSEWVAYNVEYSFGTAFPGDFKYVLRSDSSSPFSSAGEYTVYYIDTGSYKNLIDSKGFESQAPVYQMIDNYLEMEEDLTLLIQIEARLTHYYQNLQRLLSETDTGISQQEAGTVFVGDWEDSVSQRCYMEISQQADGTFDIFVHWGSSAFEDTQWTMSGRYDKTADAILYSNGTETDYVSDEYGNTSEVVNHKDGSGRIYILENGYLYWDDHMFDRSTECRFERPAY